MIERKFVRERMKEFQVGEYIKDTLKNVGHSFTKLQRTPMGEKIIIYASRPGLIVGRKGENIKKLTQSLKSKFKLENPQVEISEVENVNLDVSIVAERIASTLERYGSSKFKAIGHKVISDVLAAGALGIEIIISGKIPGARAKSWRFYKGYLKKCGDTAIEGVKEAKTAALLKSGVIGVQVRIMPPTIKILDNIQINEVAAQPTEIKGAGPEKDAKQEKGAKPEAKSAKKRLSKNKKAPEKVEAKNEA